MTPTRIDLVLGAPLGRQFLFDQRGFLPDGQLSDRLSLGPVPGTSGFLTTLPGLARVGSPSTHSRHWTEVAPAEAAAAVRDMVERREWAVLPRLDTLEVLERLATVTYSFGFRGADGMVVTFSGSPSRFPAVVRWEMPSRRGCRRSGVRMRMGWRAGAGGNRLECESERTGGPRPASRH